MMLYNIQYCAPYTTHYYQSCALLYWSAVCSLRHAVVRFLRPILTCIDLAIMKLTSAPGQDDYINNIDPGQKLTCNKKNREPQVPSSDYYTDYSVLMLNFEFGARSWKKKTCPAGEVALATCLALALPAGRKSLFKSPTFAFYLNFVKASGL